MATDVDLRQPLLGEHRRGSQSSDAASGRDDLGHAEVDSAVVDAVLSAFGKQVLTQGNASLEARPVVPVIVDKEPLDVQADEDAQVRSTILSTAGSAQTCPHAGGRIRPGGFKENEEKILSGVLSDGTYTYTDLMHIIRKSSSLAGGVLSVKNSSPKAQAACTRVAATQGAAASLGYVLTGAIATKAGVETFQQCNKVGDTSGAVLGAVDVVRGPSEMLYGLSSFPAYVMTLTHASSKSAAAAKALKSLNNVGNITGILFFTGLGLSFGAKGLYAASKYRGLKKAISGTDGAKDFKAGLDKLQSYLKFSNSERDELIAKEIGNYFIDGALDESSLDKKLGKAKKSSLYSGITGSELLKAESDAIRNTVNSRALTPAQAQKLTELLEYQVKKAKLNKLAKFNRTFGAELTLKVAQSLDPSARLELSEVQEIVETAIKKSRNTALLGLLVVFGSIAGVAATVLSYVYTGGTSKELISLALNLLTTLLYVFVDVFYLIKAFKAGGLTKKQLALMLGLTFAMMVINIAVAALSKGKKVVDIVSGVLTLLWFAAGLLFLYKWSKKPAQGADQSQSQGLSAEDIVLRRDSSPRSSLFTSCLSDGSDTDSDAE